LELLEERCLLDASVFYSFDGTGDNLTHTNWGATGQDLLRTAPAQYGDGISTLAGANRPSARVISDLLATDSTDGNLTNSRLMSDWIYAWGQFLDHDLDLTTNGVGTQHVAANIPVPNDPNDPFFQNGATVIFFNRSEFDPATGTDTSNPRQQVNNITAWLDGSVIYGSDARTADALRSHVGGRLKTSPGDLLPFNNTTYFPNIHDAATASDPTASFNIANDAHIVPNSQLFMAGDIRVNENIELTAVQTLFMREHNRIADEIHAQNPGLTDEQVYQEARAIVIAEEQVITFQEWLPALLGPNAIAPYGGYDPAVNPGIANEFSTAAFRVGHTLLAPDVQFLNPDGTTKFPAVSLANAFFNPPKIVQNGVDPIIKYLGTDNAQEVDNKIVPELQNFLFGPPGAGGLDLASLNIQRGRDHGIAGYNTVRAAYGLPQVDSFEDITSNTVVQAKLKQMYGNVNNIDLWVGGLAEDHVAGGSVGLLFTRIIADQFMRIRDGDRLWYQNLYSGAALDALQNVSLAQIVSRNTVNHDLQSRLFFFKPEIRGTVFDDTNHDGVRQAGEAGVAGRTINLLDGTGAIVATTLTDANGNYRFTIFNGMGPGTFRVVEVLPTGVFQTTANPDPIQITRGEIVSGANFGNSTVAGPGTPVDPTASAAFAVQSEADFDAYIGVLTAFIQAWK
jgi:hypothetical protein